MAKNKAATEYKKALKSLTMSVISFESGIEEIMKEPSSPERGRLIAKALNWLTVQNQIAMKFTLGYSFAKIEKLQQSKAYNA